MTRKKDRLISSFDFGNILRIIQTGFLSNTIINIKLKIMDKKFSTLMAGLMLATSMGITAQNDHSGLGEIPYRSELVKSAVTSFHCNGVTEIDSEKWYQLVVSDGAVEPVSRKGDQGQVGANATVLTMERDYATGELRLEVKTIEDATLTHSLWKIKYEKDAVSGKKFTFVNKETGYALTFDHTNAVNLNGAADAEAVVTSEDATILNGCNDVWEWYTTDKQTSRFSSKLVYSYFHNTDSVMAFAKNTNGEVVLVKESKIKAKDNLSGISNLINIQPVIAGAKVLNAAELNSMIDADGSYQGFGAGAARANENVKFKFNVDLASNPLAAAEGYLAEESQVAALERDNYKSEIFLIKQGFKSVYAGYNILFKSYANPGCYLKVTTDYHESITTGNYNGLILRDEEYANTDKINATNARFHFKVTYYPTNDSLAIEPLNAAMPNNEGDLGDLTPALYLNTINAGIAYNSLPVVGGVANCLFNKAAGVPVALASMNFAGTGVDAKKVLTVSTPYGINANETKYAAICKEDYACAESSIGPKNPAFITFNCDAHGNKGTHVEYQSNMAVKVGFDHNYTYLTRTSVPSGVYLITLSTSQSNKNDATSTEKRADGSYIVADMGGHLVYDVKEESQIFENMPATQWVVEQLNCNVYTNDVTTNKAPLVKISNREYGIEGFIGQLYTAGDNKYYFINHTPYADGMWSKGTGDGEHYNNDYFSCGDTLSFEKITPNTNGYAVISDDVLKENVYAFQHAFDNAGGLFLGVNTTDNYLQAMTGDETYYELHLISDSEDYGYTSALAGAAQLKKSAYVVKVKDTNKIDNDHKYVAVDHMYRYVVADEADIQAGKNGLRWAVFYLKENNNLDSTPYYSLVNATDLEQDKLDNVNKTAGKLAIEAISKKSKIDNLCGTSTDVFALTTNPRPLYRTLAAEYVNNLKKSITLSTGYGNEYLFEDSKSGILNYLAVENKTVQTKNEGLYADYVAKSKDRMPQYLFAVAADSVQAYYYCGENVHGSTHGLNPSCDHKVLYPGYVSGRFLVNLNDSIQNSINKVENPSKFQSDNYTRLAFVEAVHRGDSLYVLKAPYTLKGKNAITGTDVEGNVLIVPDSLVKEKEGIIYDVVELNGNHNNAAFSFRYVGDTDEEGFLLESYDVAHVNADKSLSAIGSFEGAWVRIVNGIPVLAKFYNVNGSHGTGDFVDGGWTSVTDFGQVLNQAAILTLGETDKVATSNDNITASSISIVAGEGFVTVKGAEGKTVVISNVLGQTIGNTVISSDEAKIAAPAGVVVVAVEGEAAVKAIVK